MVELLNSIKFIFKNMLSKIQKTWLWIFGGMFLIPEALFSFGLSVVEFFGIHITPLFYFFVNHQFFTDYQGYLLLALIIEWLGVLGLLIVGIKIKKYIPATLLVVVLLWLSLLFMVGHSLNNIGF